MAHELLQNEIGLILPTLTNRNKRFLTTILGTIATKVVGLAFERYLKLLTPQVT